MIKKYKLQDLTITINTKTHAGKSKNTYGKCDPNEKHPECDAKFDAIESLVLAHACAGIDIASPAYQEGYETALDAASNACDNLFSI